MVEIRTCVVPGDMLPVDEIKKAALKDRWDMICKKGPALRSWPGDEERFIIGRLEATITNLQQAIRELQEEHEETNE